MARKMVMMTALLTGVWTVIDQDAGGGPSRYNIVTNADEKADKAAMDADPTATSAYNLVVSESVATQLEERKIAQRSGEVDPDSEEAEEATGEDTSIAAQASKRVAENAQADADGGDNLSGADTRDTTAFATPPLSEAATLTDAAADADAPPAGDETETRTTTRRRSRAAADAES